MKKYILLVIFCFVSFMLQAQTWEDKVNNDPDYIKYKGEALKFYGSSDYKKEIDLGKLFREKMGKSLQNYDYNNFEQWIDENLDKTTFASKEEAVRVFNERRALRSKNDPEFSRIRSKFDELGEKYGYDEFLEFEKKEVYNVAFKMSYRK